MSKRRTKAAPLPKEKLTVVVVPFNDRQLALLRDLDPLYGEDLPQRVQQIVVMFFHDNAARLKGLED